MTGLPQLTSDKKGMRESMHVRKRMINELIRMWEYGWVGGWSNGSLGLWLGRLHSEWKNGWMNELGITGQVHK